MALQIVDSLSGYANGEIRVLPTVIPVTATISGISSRAFTTPFPERYGTDASGNFAFLLPWPSECSATTQWIVRLPDGSVYQGTVPEGVSGPKTMAQMVSSYSWTKIAGYLGQIPAYMSANPTGNHPAFVYDYVIYIDPADSKIKARNGFTDNIDFSGTDASTVINAAIASLTAAIGGNIYIAPGTYTLTSPIVCDLNHITIQGGGLRYVTKFTTTNGSGLSAHLILGVTQNVISCKVDGISVLGSLTNTDTVDGIRVHGSDITISNCRVEQITGDGVVLDSVNASVNFDNFLFNVYVIYPGRYGFNQSALVGDSEYNQCKVDGGKNLAPAVTTDGFYCQGNSTRFLFCHPFFCGSHGYHIKSSQRIHIIGGEAETNAYCGIYVDGAEQVNIENVLMYGNLGISGSADIYASTSGRLNIYNNLLTSSATGLSHIVLSGCTDFRVHGNTCYHAPQYGITVQGNSTFGRVFNNYINTGNYPVRLQDCSYTHCHGNNLKTSSTTLVIGITETNTSDNNRIYDNLLGTNSNATPAQLTISLVGANTRLRGNQGFATRNYGSGTITAGQTSLAGIAHGLSGTPSQILITPSVNPGSKIIWTANKTATTFDAVISSSNASDITFDWEAVLRGGD